MGTADLHVRAHRFITGDGERPAGFTVEDGRIVHVGTFDERLAARGELEFGPDVAILPGLVDSHVHICEPGHPDWEGFASATRAAAAGGITTLVDMPVDSVPATTSVAALREKRAAASTQSFVDVGFWGGITPDNIHDLLPLRSEGVFGFKAFLIDSGATDLPPLGLDDLRSALAAAKRLDAPVVVHAELADARSGLGEYQGPDYLAYLATRPHRMEDDAVEAVAMAARVTGCRVHIAHLSSAHALPAIATARRRGIALTAETCPHYLAIDAEQIPAGATAYKASPPIRESTNRESLWNGLADGTLSAIVSDHSPVDPALKASGNGDLGAAWGGIASLQLSLPVVWTEARRRGHRLSDVVRWMADGPARVAGLASKGRLEAGADADFVVFAPEDAMVVDGTRLHHRHPMTPYEGQTLAGVVRATYLAGQLVDHVNPTGRLLSSGSARSGRAPTQAAGTMSQSIGRREGIEP